MSRVEAVISDFGGVLTSPLSDSFAAFQDSSGISLESLGAAMAAVGRSLGVNPLFELETGRMAEHEFLRLVSEELTTTLGRPIELHGFGERYFEHLHPNEPMIDYMRELKRRGYKLAICTNNVREWEPLWRAKLPVDEIFDTVVDSGFVGTRKPERADLRGDARAARGPARHRVVRRRRRGSTATAARELGMSAVWFQSTEQAIDEIERAL